MQVVHGVRAASSPLHCGRRASQTIIAMCREAKVVTIDGRHRTWKISPTPTPTRDHSPKDGSKASPCAHDLSESESESEDDEDQEGELYSHKTFERISLSSPTTQQADSPNPEAACSSAWEKLMKPVSLPPAAAGALQWGMGALRDEDDADDMIGGEAGQDGRRDDYRDSAMPQALSGPPQQHPLSSPEQA